MTTTLLLTGTDLITDGDPLRSPDEAQLAAAAFLARYSGRTLEAYRHDLRYYFQWAADQRPRCLGRDASAHRDLPLDDGATRPGGVDD